MLVVHHLSNSRSHRILWLLEELDVPYGIRFHERQAGSHAAPEALKDIHPLGNSPIVTEEDRVVAESGAIVDYILRRPGQGRLAPPSASRLSDESVQCLHSAGGSAAFPLILNATAPHRGAQGRHLHPH